MKKIFHNNQIIITSLAIMIAIAGYLNFTNESAKNTGITSEYYQAEGDFLANADNAMEVVNNISDSNNNSTKKEKTNNENNKEESKDENVNQKVVSEGKVEGESQEVVASTDEENSMVGEAVMVSANASTNYFYNVKLNREQTRAKNKEELIEVVENTGISEDKKEEAVNKIIELTANSEREDATEMMLKARGFENTVVSIVDGKVDVIVDAKTITEEEIAQIVDIVNRKTGIENKNIVVTPVNTKNK